MNDVIAAIAIGLAAFAIGLGIGTAMGHIADAAKDHDRP